MRSTHTLATSARCLFTGLGLALLTAAPVLAHEGHGAAGISHGHASDALGFVLGAAVAVLALWHSRKP